MGSYAANFNTSQKALLAQLAQIRDQFVGRPHQSLLLRDSFGSLTRWLAKSSTITASADTDHLGFGGGVDYRETAAWVATANQTAKMTKITTSSRNAILECVLDAQIDATGCHYLLWFATGTNYTKIKYVELWLYDAAGKYAYKAWTPPGQVDPAVDTKMRSGRHQIGIGGSQLTLESGFNIATVAKIQVRFQTVDVTDLAAMTACRLDIVNPYDAAKRPCVIRLDGAYPNQDDVLSYATARGVRCVVYPTYNQVGPTEGSYMSTSQLRRHQDNGHIISTHERDAEPKGWLSMTAAQQLASYLDAQNWLAANGFHSGMGMFCTLGTQWYPWQDWEVLAPYAYHIAAGSGVGYRIPGSERVLGVTFDSNDIVNADSGTRRTTMTDAITADISAGRIVCPLFHGLSVTNTPTVADACYLIDWLASNADIQIVTPRELIDGALAGTWYA